MVALIGTFVAVGLAAAEARPDLETLAAVGAEPSVRRRLGAAQAGAIVVPGTALGLLGGVAGGWMLTRLSGQTSGASMLWRLTIPWGQTTLLGLGIPLLAIAMGYLTTRSRLPLRRRLGQ